MGKVKASELRGRDKDELESMLEDFKMELHTLRVARVTGGPSSKLSKISIVRKNVAVILTVINQKRRADARAHFAGKKYLPKDLRSKKTRAMRRALSMEEKNRKTLRVQKREKAYPKRVYAVRN